jgi:hypothetical protein
LDSSARADARLSAAGTFRLDVKGAEVRAALEQAGVRTVLLKGPAFARLLYGPARSRDYMDVDLLVDPARLERAEEVLLELRFYRVDPEVPVRQTDASVGSAVGVQGASHAAPWLRESDNLVVDLHDTLPQCGAPASVVWEALGEHLVTEEIGGSATTILDPPASALLVALHAAHHGPDWQGPAARDLAAALEQLDFDCWLAARELAVSLNADEALGAGLGTSESGREMAERLSLRGEASTARRLQWAGAPWSASVLDSLLSQHGIRRRATILARLLWPSSDALRRGSMLARRGTLGLLAAHALRPLQLLSSVPAALRALRHSRNSTQH